MSAVPCGCDPEADWTCQQHLAERRQTCGRCERVRVSNAKRCWCGAKWTEMMDKPSQDNSDG